MSLSAGDKIAMDKSRILVTKIPFTISTMFLELW